LDDQLESNAFLNQKAGHDAGNAGKLKLQLMDTAVNTGAWQPVASALVDLDMRQCTHSQTCQAEVPSAND